MDGNEKVTVGFDVPGYPEMHMNEAVDAAMLVTLNIVDGTAHICISAHCNAAEEVAMASAILRRLRDNGLGQYAIQAIAGLNEVSRYDSGKEGDTSFGASLN